MTEKQTTMSIQSYMRELIDFLHQCGRIGTAKNYERTLRSFSRFAGGDTPLSDVTERTIGEYSAYLQRGGIVRNTVSFYMRIMRAVYNKAVRGGLVAQSFPFQNVYTGVDRTRKRAVGENAIIGLHSLNLRGNARMALARDIFIFSYGTRGMSFVDIAYLKRSDIRDGYISYTRRKTGQTVSVRVEPCVHRIIRKYEDTAGNPTYVFPILTSQDPVESYRQYRAAINTYNNRLRKLSSMLAEGCHLSSYTARHSWATVARKHMAPIEVISAGLGHTSERTTRIYLASLESAAVDSVNRAILSAFGQGGEAV